MVPEPRIEDIPAEMVGFFQRKKVNPDVLDRLSKTLRSAVPLLEFDALQQPTDLAGENRYLHLYEFIFKLRSQMDKIGDNDGVTEPQCRELEEVIREMEEHLETFNAVYPITYSTRLDLWEKKEYIGGGAFGDVYRALNRKTGESCAIKEMRNFGGPGVAESLHREVQIFRQLEHQNIVKYYGSIVEYDGWNIEGSRIFIFMEHVQPGSLSNYISSRPPLQESLVRYFTAQILSGLVYLRNQGVVHRDIKPGNILVDSENNVKLADFGLAKQLAESGGNHSVPGTTFYAAPELMERGAYKSSGEGCAADIWSLGCVVIAMFTGKRPWLDCSLPEQVMYEIWINKQHPEIPANLSLEGKGFLKSCFRIDPATRPSAATLLKHPFVKYQTQLKKHGGGD